MDKRRPELSFDLYQLVAQAFDNVVLAWHVAVAHGLGRREKGSCDRFYGSFARARK